MVKVHKVTKKRAQQIAKIDMPTYTFNDMQPALMWYFLDWHNKLNKWPIKKKTIYAKEISKISEGIPIQMIGFKADAKEIKNYLKTANIKLFGYDKQVFVMKDDEGQTISEMTPTRLYALFAYLIDSISSGLQDQEGFDFVKMAKQLIKEDPR
jgi:hypothetical protein